MMKFLVFLQFLFVTVFSFSQNVLWSSDFSDVATDWVITDNSGTAGSLNWVITTTKPTTFSADGKTWTNSFTNFNSISKGNYAVVDGSNPGGGVRDAIITCKTPFSTSGVNNVVLKFSQLYARFTDEAVVEVSTNNSTWTTYKYNNKYTTNQSSTNPESVSIDISSVASNTGQVWIRFVYKGTPGDYDYGWFIDDVSVEEIPQNDLSMLGVVVKNRKESIHSCMTSSEELGMYIINKGLTSYNTGAISINYKINTNSTVTEQANFLNYKTFAPKTTLAFGDTVLCYFTTKLDLSQASSYSIKTFTSLPSDVVRLNDTMVKSISNKTLTIVTPSSPYTENFENQSLNGFTNEDVDKKGFMFALINTSANTSVTSSALGCLRINESKGTSDDWAFTPCLNLKPGLTYTLSYYTRLNADLPNNNPAVYFASTVETKFGKTANSTGMLNTIGSVQTLAANGTYVKTTSTFTVTEDATYYLGFHITNTDATKNTTVRIDDVSLTAKSSACDITAFSFTNPAVTGSITGTNIALTVSANTNVTNLIATFTASADATVTVGSITQTSGATPNTFASPLTYTVTAQDGTIKTYTVTVTVTPPLSNACDITAFSFTNPAVTGSFNVTNITLTVPANTNVTNLVATFTASAKATVKVGTTLQISGATPNTFVSPLTYTVTAEDGTVKTYIVTVNVIQPLSNACDITAFSFTNPAVSGSFNGTNITLTVPTNTNVTNLIATFTVSAKATVKVGSTLQSSGVTPNTFASPLTYIVTAEDGTVKNYIITVIVQAKSLILWSSDFSDVATDWIITDNSGTSGSLNWVITTTKPTTFSADGQAWTNTFTNFNSISKGNYAVVDGSNPGAGVRDAIITCKTPFSTLGVNNVVLKFSQLYARYTDEAVVEVSTNNNTWTTYKYNNKYAKNKSSTNPESVSIDISSVASNANQVWIRFVYKGTPGDYDYGWFIDDVSVEETPQNDLSMLGVFVKSRTESIQSCMTSSEELGMYIINKGLTTYNTGAISINYKINSNSVVTEQANFLNYKTLAAKSTLAYGDTALCFFTTKLDLSQASSYAIKTFTSLPLDVVRLNDTMVKTISNKTPTVVSPSSPYTENFENQLLNGFTSVSVTGPYKFGLTTTPNTLVTTGTSNTAYACLGIIEGKNVSDDWTFSPCLDLKAGNTYTLSFYSRLVKDMTTPAVYNFAANLEVKLGTSASVAAMTKQVVVSKALNANDTYELTTVTFKPDADGIYNLGFHVVNTDATKIAAVRIDDISLTAKSSACDITAFSFTNPAVTGSITGTNIALTVAANTNVANLIATFTASADATVTIGTTPQTSGVTPNTFASPLTYTVTAQDGTIKTYTVTVTLSQSLSSACDITAFSFTNPAVTGNINANGTAITLTVPANTNVTNLIATFTASAKATVKVGTTLQTSGVTPNTFASPLTYTVTAEDGTIKTYTVTVNISSAPSNACLITAFGISTPSVIGNINGTNIALTVPANTNVTNLIATFTASANATVKVGNVTQVSGSTSNNFTNTVQYVVTAQDGTTFKTYTVTVNVNTGNLSNAKELLTFGFTNPAITATINGSNVTANAPAGTDVTSLVSIFTVSSNATVSINSIVQVSGKNVNDFSKVITYTITAEDGTSKTYTVTVNLEPSLSAANDLLTFGFTTPAAGGIINGTAVTVTVPYGTDVTKLIAKYTVSPFATVKVGSTQQASNQTPNDFTNTVLYTITAQDGSTKVYTVLVKVSTSTGSSDKELLSFGILTPAAISGTITGTDVVINVLKGTDVTNMKLIFDVSTGAKLTVTGTTLTSMVSTLNFSNPVTVTVVAADGTTKNYTITVNVPKSSEKLIIYYKIIQPYVIAKIDTTKKEIVLELPYGTALAGLDPVFAVSNKASLYIGNVLQTSGSAQVDFSNTVVYTVVAENGTKVNYTVVIKFLPKPTLGIEENKQSSLAIYPNPSTGIFQLEANQGTLEFVITDVLGKVVYSYENGSYVSEGVEFNLADFGKGMYFATVKTNNETKMIKLEVIE